MKIVAHYSHLNGLEYLLVHKPHLWKEVKRVIVELPAETCKTKISKEKRTSGSKFYSPIELNKRMHNGLSKAGWCESRTSYWVTKDAQLIRKTLNLDPEQQKTEIEGAGHQAIYS